MGGKLVNQTTIFAGSTIAYIDTRTLYNGNYMLLIKNGENQISRKVTINR